MTLLGLVCIAFGVLGEMLGGTWFRHLFDWSYPPYTGPYSQRWVTTKILRIQLALGVVLLVVGLIAERG